MKKIFSNKNKIKIAEIELLNTPANTESNAIIIIFFNILNV